MTLGSRRSRLKATTALAIVMIAAAGAYAGFRIAELSADPVGEKTCVSVLQSSPEGGRELATAASAPTLENLTWSQRGGTINDASCVDRVDVYGIVEVHSI